MTYVAELRTDERDRERVDYASTRTPDLEAIRRAISSLDQREHTEVSLEGNDGWVMLIGGGSGRYVVSIDNLMTGARHQLVSVDEGDSSVEMVTGGQLGSFPIRVVVGLEATLRAAEHFANSGQADPGLDWDDAESD